MRLFFTGLTLQLFVGILMPLFIIPFGICVASPPDGATAAPMVFKKFAASAIDVQIDGKLDESIGLR